jgi:hypothetical protein
MEFGCADQIVSSSRRAIEASAPHDLIDPCARIYDMQPAAAAERYEQGEFVPTVHPEALRGGMDARVFIRSAGVRRRAS